MTKRHNHFLRQEWVKSIKSWKKKWVQFVWPCLMVIQCKCQGDHHATALTHNETETDLLLKLYSYRRQLKPWEVYWLTACYCNEVSDAGYFVWKTYLFWIMVLRIQSPTRMMQIVGCESYWNHNIQEEFPGNRLLFTVLDMCILIIQLGKEHVKYKYKEVCMWVLWASECWRKF